MFDPYLEELRHRFRVRCAVWFLGLALIVALLAASGCADITARTWLPRDGSPIGLELGTGVDPEVVQAGADYWLGLGVRFDVATRPALVRLEIGELPAGKEGLARWGGDITVAAGSPAVLIAHELGHELGLAHVHAACAVMSPTPCGAALSMADVDEFTRTGAF
jgi:hypothetical protein